MQEITCRFTTRWTTLPLMLAVLLAQIVQGEPEEFHRVEDSCSYH